MPRNVLYICILFSIILNSLFLYIWILQACMYLYIHIRVVVAMLVLYHDNCSCWCCYLDVFFVLFTRCLPCYLMFVVALYVFNWIIMNLYVYTEKKPVQSIETCVYIHRRSSAIFQGRNFCLLQNKSVKIAKKKKKLLFIEMFWFDSIYETKRKYGMTWNRDF